LGGYLATSGAKYDVMFLLCDPDFLQRWQNFDYFSRSDARQTDRRQTRRPFHKALTLTMGEPNKHLPLRELTCYMDHNRHTV